MKAMSGAVTFAALVGLVVACGGDSKNTVSEPPCVAGQTCDTGDVCTIGTTTCASSTSAATCTVVGHAPEGTACGTGQTCSAGKCVASAPPPCSSLVDGTPCGSGHVCASGDCVPQCVPAASCDTQNACTVGTTTCASPWSKPDCTANGQKPDGTDCGDGQVCSGGACKPKTTVLAVSLQDAVVLVNQATTLTAQVIVGSGSPSLEVDWVNESCPGATITPARGVSTSFHAPANPGKCRIRATSVADPSKWHFAYVIVENAPLRLPLSIPAGGDPYGITRGSYGLGHYCIYAVSTSAGTITLIESEDGSVGGTWYVGANPRGDISSDGYRRVWITVTGENKVARLDRFSVLSPAGAPPVAKFDVGSMPHGLVVTPSDSSVWVANYGSDSLTHLDRDGALLWTFGIGQWGHAPTGVAYDGSTLWVPTSTAVLNLDTSGHLLRSITPVADPYGIVYDGRYVWFANHAGKTIVRITPASGATATFTVGANPLGIASDGDTVWVANTGDNTVSEVRAADGAILSTLKTGLMPYGVVVDWSKSLWVTDYGTGDVRRLF